MSPKAVLLLSGGFDSPVAAYVLQHEGYDIVPLHITNIRYAGEESSEKCKRAASALNIHTIFVADMSDATEAFVAMCKHSYYFVLIKRLFLRLASLLCEKIGAKYIVMGDSLGQVGSQTLANVNSIQDASKFRVLTPLISMDKDEIIKLSRQIGTHDISVGPEMCDVMGPKHPVTRSEVKRVRNEEARVDNYEALLQDMWSNVREITIQRSDA